MFNNLTLKATMKAEKEKEKEDIRMAGRYVKIRALLDQAEEAINGSNIVRNFKNKLLAKLLKARKALDKDLNVEEVTDTMMLIITMINKEIKDDKQSIDNATSEMRRDLDNYYKYDYNKFLQAEHQNSRPMSRERKGYSTDNETGCSSKLSVDSEEALHTCGEPQQENTADEKSSELVDESEVPEWNTDTEVETELEISEVESIKSAAVEQKLTKSAVSESVTADIADKTVIENLKPARSKKKSMKKLEMGISTIAEEIDVEDSAEKPGAPPVTNTLETLNLSLSILQEIPEMILNQTQHEQLVTTMKATKNFLMTPEGCAILQEPLTLLKKSIDLGTKGVPKEPMFSQALVETYMVISSLETVSEVSSNSQ